MIPGGEVPKANRVSEIVGRLLAVAPDRIRHRERLNGARSPAKIEDARHVARWLMRRVSDLPPEEIARLIGGAYAQSSGDHRATTRSIMIVESSPRLFAVARRALQIWHDPRAEGLIDRETAIGAELRERAKYSATAEKVLRLIEAALDRRAGEALIAEIGERAS